MKEFEFNGNWEFDLELNHFSNYFSFSWIGEPNLRREKILFQIIDVKDENPNPEVEQIKSINFILGNQELIVQSIYETLKNKIIPEFRTYLGEDEEIFLNLDSLDDLNKFLGIGNISISNLLKDGYAYNVFYFNSFRCDLEHGLNMMFHKDRFIGTHEDYKEVYEDLGLKYEDVLKEMSFNHQKKMQNKDFKFYRPKSNSEVLKPWQITENGFYLSRLLHSKQPVKFLEFMEQNEDEIEYDWNTLHNLAKNYEFEDVVKYLEKIK